MSEQQPRQPYDQFYYDNYCGMRYERNGHWLHFFGNIAEHIVQEIAPRTAMDVGCAFGLLVEALRDRDVEAFGVDISEYALSQVRPDVRTFCNRASATDELEASFDLIVCIEVLEHLEKRDALQAIANICRHTQDVLFSSTFEDYAEATHVNVHPREYWVEAFAKHGFVRDLEFDASFISRQAMRFRAFRDPLARQLSKYERILALRDEEVSQLRATLMAHEERLENVQSGQYLAAKPNLVAKVYFDYGEGFSEESATTIARLEPSGGTVDWRITLDRLARSFRIDPAATTVFLTDFAVEVVTPEGLVQVGRAQQELVNVVPLTTAGVLAFGEDPQCICNRALRPGETLHVHFGYDVLGVSRDHQLAEAVTAVAEERAALQRLTVKLRAGRRHWKRRAQAAYNRVNRQAEGLKRIHESLKVLLEALQASNQKRSHLEAALIEVSELKTQLEVARVDATAVRIQLDRIHMSISWRITHPLRVLRHYVRRLTLARAWAWPRLGTPVPASDLRQGERPHTWVSSDGDPWFLFEGTYPSGWVEIRYRLRTEATHCNSRIYVDYGDGLSESGSFDLPEPDPATGTMRHAFYIAHDAQALRFDPISAGDTFELSELSIRPISKLRLAWDVFTFARTSRTVPLRTLVRQVARGDLRSVKLQMLQAYIHGKLEAGRTYTEWCTRYDTLTHGDKAAIEESIAKMDWKPLISVVMPVYNVDPRWLREAVESVRGQIYPNWQLCIADDASTLPGIRELLEEYIETDERVVVKFRQSRGHISAASNSALALATGDFVALLDHDDTLAPHALYMVANELNAHPDAALLYSDEDKIDEEGMRTDPYFKSDWNPDLFLGQNMISHLGVYRTELVHAVGGFREGFEGSQDYDLALRVTEHIREAQIRHIPHVLYHWRMVEGSTATDLSGKTYAFQAAGTALQQYCDRNGLGARVEASRLSPGYHRVAFPIPDPEPKVSVIIPTKNGRDMLSRCIRSLRATEYDNLEIIVVNNGSDDPATLAYFDAVREQGVNVLEYPGVFNYSAITNFAVEKAAHGELLLFLNNDVHALDRSWLREMVSHAVRPGVGVVGAALYYPDGRLQHGGVVVGAGGVAGHAHHLLSQDQPGYFGRAKLTQDLSAVTGACMLVKRSIFYEVGKFDGTNLPVAFNDVDLCLRVREMGLKVVWTPYARLLHLESATRSRDMSTPERQGEVRYMQDRWSGAIAYDPYYNPNLSLESPHFRLAWPPRGGKPWLQED